MTVRDHVSMMNEEVCSCRTDKNQTLARVTNSGCVAIGETDKVYLKFSEREALVQWWYGPQVRDDE